LQQAATEAAAHWHPGQMADRPPEIQAGASASKIRREKDLAVFIPNLPLKLW